jgi:hypothetical protein
MAHLRLYCRTLQCRKSVCNLPRRHRLWMLQVPRNLPSPTHPCFRVSIAREFSVVGISGFDIKHSAKSYFVETHYLYGCNKKDNSSVEHIWKVGLLMSCNMTGPVLLECSMLDQSSQTWDKSSDN